MSEDHTATRARIASEQRVALGPQLFDRWYPLAIDTRFGGYFSDISKTFRLTGSQRKLIVTQARHLWTTAKAAEFFPEHPLYRSAADHGFEFLQNVMWDQANGGFHNLLSREGELLALGGGPPVKEAYGNAFAIYALAAHYRLTADEDALELAKAAFHWLEAHSHDEEHGGYFRYLQPDGTPMRAGHNGIPPKEQDTTLHLLEAFIELIAVWPDDLLRTRLEELLQLLCGPMNTSRGSLALYFTADWTRIRLPAEQRRARDFRLDHISFGHDIEAAFLLIQASAALGRTNDRETHAVSRRLVDHSLEHGWDEEHGGLFDGAYAETEQSACDIVFDTKTWWVAAESLNTLSLMADLYPEDHRYFDRFVAQWDYCDRYLLDHQHGGWHWQGTDHTAESAQQHGKGFIWKGTYHTARALMNSIQRLEAAATG